jgi:hypothetical protein
MKEDLGAPGRSLFPEYPSLAGMYEKEVEGLTDEQLDRHRPEKGWGIWSIRDQVSHMAFVAYRWFLFYWGKTLFGEALPRDASLADPGGADRMLDPACFHTMYDLLAALRDGFDLAWEILGGETLGSLREKVQSRRVPADSPWPSGDTMRAWTENVMLKVHPNGYWRDQQDPDLFHYNLEFTFRHVLWEAYAHLRTIQMHKKAGGLDPIVTIPEVGYLTVLKWE